MSRVQDRDRALRRVSVLTRAVVVGSVAMSGGLTALVAWAQPGRAKSSLVRVPASGPTPGRSRSRGQQHQGPARVAPSPPVTSARPAPTAHAPTAHAPVAPVPTTATPDTLPVDTLPPETSAPQPAYDSSGGGVVIVSGQS